MRIMRDYLPIVCFLTCVMQVALSCYQWRLLRHYRANAMDLCAWHARVMVGDPSSPEATIRWDRIVSGIDVCTFCGQKHNGDWVSRNAWESQVNALIFRDGINE